MAEQWTFGSINLQQAGVYGVRLLTAVDGAPARRAGDVILPGRRGRRPRYAPVDQRLISLAVMVQGATRSALQTNVDALLAALGRDGRQTLTRTLADGSQRSLLAEVAAAVTVQPQSDRFASLAIDFLAEPWWQSGSLTSTGSGTISSSPKTFTVVNAGSAEHMAPVITVAGNITNPKVQIGDVWVQYTGAITSTLTITCGTWTVSGGSYSAKNVTHGGAVAWMVVPPGTSTVTVTGSGISGSPSVTIAFYARYF